MSVESARLFVQRMESDAEFARKIGQCQDAGIRMTVAKEAGFDFTAAELKAVKAELSDEELDMIAGGSRNGCHREEVEPGRYDMVGL